jgi:hypothetical protein
VIGDLTDKIPELPNPKTKTFNFNYSPAPPFNTDQRHMVYSNGSLYIYSDTTGIISSIPFPSPYVNPIQSNIHRASPITKNERNMFFGGSRQNSSYLGYLTRPTSEPIDVCIYLQAIKKALLSYTASLWSGKVKKHMINVILLLLLLLLFW